MFSTLPIPVEELVAAHRNGLRLGALATRFNCSRDTVRRRLRQAGERLHRRGPPRQYSLNEEFFENIETEAQAYWLGFFFADARVARTRAGNWFVRVDLGAIDRPHLVKMCQDFKSDSPINPGHDGESAYVDFCSAKLCRQLLDLDCGPDKTGRHGTPTLPVKLEHHFYRGYSDGDGSLYPFVKSNWRYEAVGSKPFIVQFQRWLVTHVDVNFTKLVVRRGATAFRYTGGEQVERICRALYQDSTVHLDRKFEMYQRLLRRSRRSRAVLT